MRFGFSGLQMRRNQSARKLCQTSQCAAITYGDFAGLDVMFARAVPGLMVISPGDHGRRQATDMWSRMRVDLATREFDRSLSSF